MLAEKEDNLTNSLAAVLMQNIGTFEMCSDNCFLVFLGRISVIKDDIPPLSPLFIPSISSIMMAIGLRFFIWNILATFTFDILSLAMFSMTALFRISLE